MSTPASTEPDSNEPDNHATVGDEQASEQPARDEQASEQPARDEQASEQPASTQPESDEPDGDEPDGDEPDGDEPDGDEPDEPWRRLSVRVVYVDVIRVALSGVAAYFGTVVLNDDGPVWPLVVGSIAGVLGALFDLVRWMTTRYRITPTRVEMRSGLAARRHRTVPRDRIRSVDSSARALARLFRLQMVHIGSGESGSSFTLDSLDKEHAARLQQELLSGARRPSSAPITKPKQQENDDAATPEGEETTPEPAEPEEVIARFRWQWVLLNMIQVWSSFVIVGPLFGLYWLLRPLGIDLLDVGDGMFGGQASVLLWIGLLAVVVLVVLPLGTVGLAIMFVLENWNFELVRAGTPPATALVTRRGLINTQTVQRDSSRLRGLTFKEPLAWRWLQLAETSVITTGLRDGVETSSSTILPRLQLEEARKLAAKVLQDGHRPMESELLRHPRGALTRRLGLAVYGPALASGVLLLFGLSDAIPDWVWPLPLTLLPLTLILAVAAYRSLGHALTGPYLVIRRGALNQNTVALQKGAVIGWNLEQTIFQRLGNRITIGIATAAGDRHYLAPDAGLDQALAFISGATPQLAAQFIESGSPASGLEVETATASTAPQDDQGDDDRSDG